VLRQLQWRHTWGCNRHPQPHALSTPQPQLQAPPLEHMVSRIGCKLGNTHASSRAVLCCQPQLLPEQPLPVCTHRQHKPAAAENNQAGVGPPSTLLCLLQALAMDEWLTGALAGGPQLAGRRQQQGAIGARTTSACCRCYAASAAAGVAAPAAAAAATAVVAAAAPSSAAAGTRHLHAGGYTHAPCSPSHVLAAYLATPQRGASQHQGCLLRFHVSAHGTAPTCC
jgi:hypothetical protein